MSANISQVNGASEIFVAGEPAWHKLGVNVQKAQSWKDAVKLAHLNWPIDKIQLINPLSNVPIDYYALMRMDIKAILSIVGKNYGMIQNDDCFSYVDDLLENINGAHYVSAGALDGGKIVWCLASIPGSFEPVKGDKHDTYLLFTDYRDHRAAECRICLTRVVCANTLAAAMSEATKAFIRFRHTSNVTDKMAAAKDLVVNVKGDIKKLENKMRQLAQKKVDQVSFMAVFNSLFPSLEKSARAQNQAAVVGANFQRNDGGKIAGINGTAYALYQAYTQYIDHQKDGFRTNGESMDIKRAENAMFGAGDTAKRAALDKICNIMGIAGEPEIVGAGKSGIDSILSNVAL